MEDVHFIPLDESGLHEESRECKCNPSVSIVEGNTIIIHNRLSDDLKVKVKN